MKAIACVAMFLAGTGALAAALTPAQYADEVKRLTFLSDKIETGKRIGALQTDAAFKGLMLLLADDSYWNRSGAVWGLVLFNRTDATGALIDKLFTDHMIDDEVEKALQANAGLHLSGLMSAYGRADAAQRSRLAGIIAHAKTPGAERFLKEQIAVAMSSDRQMLLGLITEQYTTGNYAYIRGFIDDPQLRDVVLGHIVKHGDAKELTFLRTVAGTDQKNSSRIIAYVGIARWDSEANILQTYLGALRSSEPDLQRGAISAFRDRRSPDIHNELCRLTRRGDSQPLRMEAALELTRYRSRESVPYLISALREVQGETVDRHPLMNAFLGVVSLGMIPVLEDLSRRQSRSSFRSDINDISAGLTAVTGQNFGPSYGQWKQWAVYQGWTVDGETIVQRMLSGYPDTREQARQAAVRLLGFLDMNQWKEKNPEQADLTDTALSLALAGRLYAAGVIRDEKY